MQLRERLAYALLSERRLAFRKNEFRGERNCGFDNGKPMPCCRSADMPSGKMKNECRGERNCASDNGEPMPCCRSADMPYGRRWPGWGNTWGHAFPTLVGHNAPSLSGVKFPKDYGPGPTKKAYQGIAPWRAMNIYIYICSPCQWYFCLRMSIILSCGGKS